MQKSRKLRREDKIDSSILIYIDSFSTIKKARDNMLHLQLLPLLDPLERDIALQKRRGRLKSWYYLCPLMLTLVRRGCGGYFLIRD